MDRFELFQRFSVALAIGLLVGIERGWQARTEADGERAAGLRTHALAALLGAVFGSIAQTQGDGGGITLGLAFVAFTGVIAAFRFREAMHDGTFGATTAVALMLVFALGAFSVVGDMQVAGACGVTVAGLLALKSGLHGWVRQLTWLELRSGLLLLAMTFILLPLLPNKTVDPWNALNPFELWLMTIMIAGISFAGYTAMKLFGANGGSAITGVAGGLASSTAVTITMARLAKEHPDQRDPLLAAALFASATMMARVLGVAGIANVGLLASLALPIGLAGLVLAAAGLFLLKRDRKHGASEDGGIALKNPFELSTVLKFGALLTVITFLAQLIKGRAGDAGIYTLAAVSGIADVDALTLSVARMSTGQIETDVAALAILIVVAVNTVSKAMLGWFIGGYEAGWRLLATAGVAIAAGGVGVLLKPML